MKKLNNVLVFTNGENEEYFSLYIEKDLIINVEKEYEIQKDNLMSLHEKEDFLHSLSKKALKYNKIKAIIVDLKINPHDSNEAFRLIHHIRLSDDKTINNLPVILIHNEDIVLNKHTSIDDLMLFKTQSIIFEKKENLFHVDEISQQKRIDELINEFKKKFNYTNFINKLRLHQPDTTTRHQIANEWGAYKLAHEAGFDISYSIPQTLYFKFLKAKYSDNNDNNRKNNNTNTEKEKTIFDKKLNILLIDDNYDKGWKEALEKILPADIDAYENISNALTEIISTKGEKYKKYDLVFLDLYMPKKKGGFEIDYSLQLLENLKVFNPSIPIIIFTASNKVWNLQKIIELGADGYFVKEAPENANIPGFSKRNFDEFVKTVKNSFEKGQLLKAYWDAIQKIKGKFLPEIKDSTNLKFKSRIEERLQMFFGLLKRGFEQTEFNKKLFFFSDYELAYMTLWSILNEIQEAYYEKIHPNEHLTISHNGVSYSKHPNNRTIIPIPGYNWKIRKQQDFLIKHDFEFNLNGHTPMVTDKNYYQLESSSFQSHLGLKKSSPFYEIVNNSNNKNIRWQIANQIAFLILAKEQLKNHSNKNVYLANLKNLNDIRNHLYLTHGNDISTDFYSDTEEEKRKKEDYKITPEESIKDLFELVGFLLTGKEIPIKI